MPKTITFSTGTMNSVSTVAKLRRNMMVMAMVLESGSVNKGVTPTAVADRLPDRKAAAIMHPVNVPPEDFKAGDSGVACNVQVREEAWTLSRDIVAREAEITSADR